jgi:UDPglucose 6-dehydrogenase
MQTTFYPLNVAIIGTGYVGLTTGVALAFLGHSVIATDTDESKIRALKGGESPIHEPGLEELLRLSRNRIAFTLDTKAAVEHADVIVIAVGTPSKDNGQADTQFVETAAREVASGLAPERSYTTIVKSTVPIGTNRRVHHVMQEVLAQRGCAEGSEVDVVSNPEFLREGTAFHDMLYPDRIIVGAETQRGTDRLRRLYQPILEQTFVPPDFLPRPRGYASPAMVTTDPVSAEMIKYASNAFLAMKISFINEVAGLCECMGGDISEVARGVGLDSRIGPQFLRAGLGWGGSCFPKDTAALVAMGEEHGCPMHLAVATRRVNEGQRLHIVEKLQDMLKGVRGRVIGVLGLAFKPGTDDVRESPAIAIIRLLLEREAHVRAHDPIAATNARNDLRDTDVVFFDDIYALANGADALIVATEWPEYRSLDLAELREAVRTPILVDARNLLSAREAMDAGFKYLGVGR